MTVERKAHRRKHGGKIERSLPANHPAMVHHRIDGRIDRDEQAHAQIMEWIRIAKGGETCHTSESNPGILSIE